MSECNDSNREALLDQAYLKTSVDTIVAHCDNALEWGEDWTGNDGRLRVPLNAKNLLMATWQAPSPDLSNVYVTAPKEGEPIEIVARYWYGALSECVNLWLRNPEPEVSDTFNISVRLERGTNDIRLRASSLGRDHNRGAEVEPTVENTTEMLTKLFPGAVLPERATLGDMFREAIWHQIEEGADGYTREEYEKVLGTSCKQDDSQRSMNGFQLTAKLVNRTHLQDKNFQVHISVNRAFWGVDYGGIYDGLLDRVLTIEQGANGFITDASQKAEVRLFSEPYIQQGTPGLMSEGPIKTDLPTELEAIANPPSIPDRDMLEWFLRLATRPIEVIDTHVFH